MHLGGVVAKRIVAGFTANQIKLAEQHNLLESVREEIVAFRTFLAGPKFTGYEPVRVPCAHHRDAAETILCATCYTREERKDWISTADVDRWLAGILSTLDT